MQLISKESAKSQARNGRAAGLLALSVACAIVPAVVDTGTVISTAWISHAFWLLGGIAYNASYEAFCTNRDVAGWTWLAVVIGATLVIGSLYGLFTAFGAVIRIAYALGFMLSGFAMWGIPMAIGDWQRKYRAAQNSSRILADLGE